MNGGFGGDPLSAPSGFTSRSGTSHASLSRQWGDLGPPMSDGEGRSGDGPPRKRMRGQSQEVSDITHSPASPDVRPLGQRRNLVHARPNDSEEPSTDVRDLFDNPTTPPVARGHPTAQISPISAPSPAVDDVKFTRFAMTMPEHPKDTVRLAWKQSNGDARQASNLLQDQAWLRHPRGIEQSTPEPVGRVKAIDDAHKAERAAARERGKTSLIYANRLNLPVSASEASSTPSKQAPPTPSSFHAPLSPDVSRPRVKRAKKIVIDSDSEEQEEEEEAEPIAKRQKVATEETRALEYYNTAAAAGLQELTGPMFLLA